LGLPGEFGGHWGSGYLASFVGSGFPTAGQAVSIEAVVKGVYLPCWSPFGPFSSRFPLFFLGIPSLITFLWLPLFF